MSHSPRYECDTARIDSEPHTRVHLILFLIHFTTDTHDWYLQAELAEDLVEPIAARRVIVVVARDDVHGDVFANVCLERVVQVPRVSS